MSQRNEKPVCDTCGATGGFVKTLDEIEAPLRRRSMAPWITRLCTQCAKRFGVEPRVPPQGGRATNTQRENTDG